MSYLIGYDIREPRRLTRIHKRMTKHATPIQYSVFLLEGGETQLQACLAEVLKIFDKKVDDLRVYPLPKGSGQWYLGKSILPEEIIWTALPFSVE